MSDESQIGVDLRAHTLRGRVKGTKVGRMNGRTPLQKKVPVALDKATSCTLSAEAVLTKKGKVTLVLYAY